MTTECAMCGGGPLVETMESSPFQYGKDGIELPAIVPVVTCQSCKLSYTDWRAEEIRDRAVKQHLAGLR